VNDNRGRGFSQTILENRRKPVKKHIHSLRYPLLIPHKPMTTTSVATQFFCDDVAYAPWRADSGGGGDTDQLAVATSSMTDDVWNGQLVIVERNTSSWHIPTYGGNAAVTWMGSAAAPLLVSGGDDGTVHIWRVDARRRAAAFTAAACSAASAAKVQLSELSGDEATWAREMAAGYANASVRLASHDDVVTCVAAAPSTSLLLTGGWDRRVLVFDVASTSPTRVVDSYTRLHDGRVNACCWIASTADTATGGGVGVNCYATARDASVCDVDRRVGGSAAAMLCAPSSLTNAAATAVAATAAAVAVGYESGEVSLFDLRKNNESVGDALLVDSGGGRVNALDFHADGRTLAAASDDGHARIISTASDASATNCNNLSMRVLESHCVGGDDDAGFGGDAPRPRKLQAVAWAPFTHTGNANNTNNNNNNYTYRLAAAGWNRKVTLLAAATLAPASVQITKM
jgi:WD40 repeat protein